MISEGSCDTEDCSTGCKITLNYILKLKNLKFKLQYYRLYCIFLNQINAAFVSIRDFYFYRAWT